MRQLSKDISEKEFALWHQKNVLTTEYPDFAFYFIETEETQRGFPDLLAISKVSGVSKLFEYKVSDKDGVITFQKTQPPFYKRNPFLDITVVAYDVRFGEVIRFKVDSLFDDESEDRLRDNLKVRL